MAEGTKVTRVFAKTYSKENRIYRSWRADALRPVPIISSYKNVRAVEEHVPVPSNSPVSSDSSTTTESNSSLYSDNTQFMSLSQHQRVHSKTTLSDSSSTLDDDEQEVTLKNPNAPYRSNKKVHYSVIIEESDDTNKPETAARKSSSVIPARTMVRNLPKSSSAAVRNVQKTKMMKDSLQNNNESDQAGPSFFDLDSSSISLIDEDDKNCSEVSSECVSSNQEESNQQNPTHAALSEDNLEISDIEVMRDAPLASVGATTKGKREKKDLASYLKISAVKIFPQQERKLKPRTPQKSHKSKSERKNSTLNAIKSAKNIQEISFGEQDISHIPACPTLSSECAFGDDNSTTLKGTPRKMPSVTNTLKEIHSNIQRDSPSTLTKKGINKVNFIRMPKKHNIKQVSVCNVPSPLDSESVKQVSFQRAANEESLYEPGSAVKKNPAPVQLPQLSPSLSILKKAVSAWNLHSEEENTENLQCKVTSTPLSKRKSNHYRPSKMAFSFNVSAVPLPSYDNDDLMVPLPPPKTDISKVSSITKERSQSPSSCISKHITPSKQVKRDSPEPSIPSRPLKRRRYPVLASSSDTEQEFSNKTAICKSSQPRQKKRLEYRDKGVGPPKCVLTMLPDVHFHQVRNTPTKHSSGPCLDLSFLNNVPEDIITTLPDSVFS